MSGAIGSFLEDHTPYRVCGEAGDSLVAIEEAKKARCDMILLDLGMPKVTGVEAASVLRGIFPSVKIVGFSTAGEEVGAWSEPASMWSSLRVTAWRS